MPKFLGPTFLGDTPFGPCAPRQTVLSGPVVSGGQTLLSTPAILAAGTGLQALVQTTISGVYTPIVISFAGGFGVNGPIDTQGVIAAPCTVDSLPANATSYIYADLNISGTLTIGSTRNAPNYSLPNQLRYQYMGTLETVAGAISDNNNYGTPSNAFDGYYVDASGTYWQGYNTLTTSPNTSWIGQDFGRKVVVSSYTLAQANHSYAVSTVQLQGSDDAVIWNDVGSVDTIYDPLYTSGLRWGSNPTALGYRYWRVISKTAPTSSQHWRVYGLAFFTDKTHWFDLNTYKMFQFINGAKTSVQRVFLGEVTTDGASVTSVTTYPYSRTLTQDIVANNITAMSVNLITGPAVVAPLIAGVAAVGLSTKSAKEDHVHPTPIPASVAAVLDFPSIPANTVSALTVAVPGAAVGSCVMVASPATLEASLIVTAFVSAANTVIIRVANISATAVDPASATFNVKVVA